MKLQCKKKRFCKPRLKDLLAVNDQTFHITQGHIYISSASECLLMQVLYCKPQRDLTYDANSPLHPPLLLSCSDFGVETKRLSCEAPLEFSLVSSTNFKGSSACSPQTTVICPATSDFMNTRRQQRASFPTSPPVSRGRALWWRGESGVQRNKVNADI